MAKKKKTNKYNAVPPPSAPLNTSKSNTYSCYPPPAVKYGQAQILPPFTINGKIPPWRLRPPQQNNTFHGTVDNNNISSSRNNKPFTYAQGIKFNLNSNIGIHTRKPIPVTLHKALPPPPPPPPLKAPSSSKGQWPPALRKLVDGSFAACSTDTQRDAVEKELKDRIQAAIKAGNLYGRDWSAEPPLKALTTNVYANDAKNRNVEYSKNQKVKPSLHDQKRQERLERFTLPPPEDPATIQARQEANRASREEALLTMAKEGIDWDEHSIIGTCLRIEKAYLRLTSAPKPNTVRPLHILRKALDWIQRIWSARENDYHFVCDQLKSIRQDLTVQGIQNSFTLSVYECHARIAIEEGDLGEFNQCLSQLFGALYKLNNGTSFEKKEEGAGSSSSENNVDEFSAYKILYLMVTENSAEMNKFIKTLPNTLSLTGDDDKETLSNHTWKATKHALAQRHALALHAYTRFFALYKSTPNLGKHLLSHLINRERRQSLAIIAKAYRPCVNVAWLASVLAFEGPDSGDFREWLREEGVGDGVFDSDNNVDCKQLMSTFS